MAASKRTTRSSSKKSMFPKISTPKIDFSMKAQSQKFLFFSAFVAVSYAAAAMVAPWDVFGKTMMPILPALGVTEKSFASFKDSFVCLMLGWGVGKVVAASSSQKATKLFCQLNCAPMGYFVYCCYNAQTVDWPLWALFLASYAYFGYLTK